MHFDSHVHSAASPDSELDPYSAISKLKSKGLGVIFTEHADFVTPKNGRDEMAIDFPSTGIDFICDFDIYPSQYRSIRAKYGGTALLGIEIGFSAAFLPLNTQTADNDYDFVLGAIHFVDGCDVYSQASNMEAWAFCRRYLTYGTKMVNISGFFDSLAHIDYVARYSKKINDIFRYDNFPEEFDDLLTAIADRGLALEINTSRFGDPNTVKHLTPIYKRFKTLGGKYVTIGSDSHAEWGLGRHYPKALGLANMAGLTPVYFKERKLFKC